MTNSNNKTAANDYVEIGKIGTPYGVKGWIKVSPFSDDRSQILTYDPWYIEDETGWRPIEVTDGKPHGKVVIVKFVGFDTPEQSRLLTGLIIGIKRSQLAKLKKDEYYWRDLEGLTVINQVGEILGTVLYLMETGANDVMVIKNDKLHAVPYIKEVVQSVDLEKKEIRVNWDL